ncbi:uncharacterized protein LOC134669278 [Cydia fagiglandana]|uniref:uncharacterized protein LOC134669278 n=1 Tax=Cydia fagiglandana TaxID=1458189 RepID=UPI002FEE151F
MRIRKKPDLRIQIPSYPHDFVEMPPETRRRILEATTPNTARTPTDIPFIDADTPQAQFQVGDPLSPIDGPQLEGGFRASTPTVKIVEPEEIELKRAENKDEKGDNKDEKNEEAENPVQYRKMRNSISMPHGLHDYELEQLRREHEGRVSRIFHALDLS